MYVNYYDMWDGRNHGEVLLFAGGSVLTVAVKYKYEEEKSLEGF